MADKDNSILTFDRNYKITPYQPGLFQTLFWGAATYLTTAQFSQQPVAGAIASVGVGFLIAKAGCLTVNKTEEKINKFLQPRLKSDKAFVSVNLLLTAVSYIAGAAAAFAVSDKVKDTFLDNRVMIETRESQNNNAQAVIRVSEDRYVLLNF